MRRPYYSTQNKKFNLLNNFIISFINQLKNLINSYIYVVKSSPNQKFKVKEKKENVKVDLLNNNGKMILMNQNIVIAVNHPMDKW